MGAYRFSMAPNISVPRSKFNMPFNHATSFNHGKLVPIDCFEILPGDEFKCDFSALIRMSTPIVPIFGNITAHVHAFFIPMRLVWEHTKEFYGENRTAAGYQQGSYSIPKAAIDCNDEDSVSHYLGKPICGTTDQVTHVSILKERCYCLCWNEYYRAQQVQSPILINLGDTGAIGTFTDGNSDYTTAGTKTFDFDTKPFNVCKEFDYFTACTTSPQYGSAVTLPLGTTAPVIFHNGTSGSISGNTGFYVMPASSVSSQNNVSVNAGTTSGVGTATSASVKGQLLADLSNATAASINTIRYAFQVQKWLERANFGSRFFEMLNLHYGVTSPDARLQRPEYLGGFDFYINIDQVVSMSGYSASSSQEVGQVGGMSVTGVKNKNLFHKAFVEPGYVMVLISTTQERSYTRGVLREDLRKDRFDFYFPEFANLGDQLVTAREIYCDDDAGTDSGAFGYQEHWAEYRYRANRVSGLLDPHSASSLDFWTLADNPNASPYLNDGFIRENRDNITRCLVSGATGPDYIGDFHFNYTAIREMPLYTIPGLVDHFGTM